MEGKVGIGTNNPSEKLEVNGGNFFVNGTRNLFLIQQLVRLIFMKMMMKVVGQWHMGF